MLEEKVKCENLTIDEKQEVKEMNYRLSYPSHFPNPSCFLSFQIPQPSASLFSVFQVCWYIIIIS